jgi:hypothetical protein
MHAYKCTYRVTRLHTHTQIATQPQFTSMVAMMAIGLSIGVGLGKVVGATTSPGQKISEQK